MGRAPGCTWNLETYNKLLLLLSLSLSLGYRYCYGHCYCRCHYRYYYCHFRYRYHDNCYDSYGSPKHAVNDFCLPDNVQLFPLTMMTSYHGNASRVICPLWGECNRGGFPLKGPVIGFISWPPKTRMSLNDAPQGRHISNSPRAQPV